jgi:hypothetical protein
MNAYKFGNIVLPDLEAKADSSNITIGGDKGDVHIETATQAVDGGVLLYGIELRSSYDFTPEEAREVAEDVIRESYESIGSATFVGRRR